MPRDAEQQDVRAKLQEDETIAKFVTGKQVTKECMSPAGSTALW